MIKVLGTQQLFVKWEQYLPDSVHVAWRPEWGPQITLLSFLPPALTTTLKNQTRWLKLCFDYRKPQLFSCLSIRDTHLDPMSLFIWLFILRFLIQLDLHPLLLGSLSPNIFFFLFSVLATLGLYRIVRPLHLWCMGSRAHWLSSCSTKLLHSMWDLSSLTRDWTHVPCIGGQILNHWITREVL